MPTTINTTNTSIGVNNFKKKLTTPLDNTKLICYNTHTNFRKE